MSIWNLHERRRKHETLTNDLEIDTLIIGAGITGMTTAYYLRNEPSVCVVDANEFGHGVTLNTTAKINYFQQTVYGKIATITNYNNAVKYLKSQKEAIASLKEIIETEQINCDFEQVPSYVFANSEKEIANLENEVIFLKENGVSVVEADLPADTLSYKAYYVEDTYIFNPYKYLQGLYKILKGKKIPFYEKTKIIDIRKNDDGYLCYTGKYQIKAKKVVLACHYPFFLFPLVMPVRCSLEKSYIIVSKVKKDGCFTCISSNNPVYSSRFYNDGKNIYQISLAKSNNLANNQDDLYFFKRVKEIFNLEEQNIIMKYTNIDIMTPDHMPYIGKIKGGLYIGVGYNTWGMTNGVLAGKLLAKEVLNQKNEYHKLFYPNRFGFANLIKLPSFVWNNAKTFIGTKLNKNKSWYSSRVLFIKKDGKSLASYIDDDGVKHTVYNKCPHLGCSLLFNEIEKTWDCPCHSSRFSLDGRCIKGPSCYDISYKEDDFNN